MPSPSMVAKQNKNINTAACRHSPILLENVTGNSNSGAKRDNIVYVIHYHARMESDRFIETWEIYFSCFSITTQ